MMKQVVVDGPGRREARRAALPKGGRAVMLSSRAVKRPVDMILGVIAATATALLLAPSDAVRDDAPSVRASSSWGQAVICKVKRGDSQN